MIYFSHLVQIVQLHIHCCRLNLCDCFLYTSLKIGMFRIWNAFSQRSVNVFVYKSLCVGRSRGAGDIGTAPCNPSYMLLHLCVAPPFTFWLHLVLIFIPYGSQLKHSSAHSLCECWRSACDSFQDSCFCSVLLANHACMFTQMQFH